MSRVSELEREIERLTPEELRQLSCWMAKHLAQLGLEGTPKSGSVVRDHRGFLNSYSPEDEGLYDDTTPRR